MLSSAKHIRIPALIVAALFCVIRARATEPVVRTGFPVANFGIGAEVTPEGRLLGRIVYNPPVLGRWLEDVAEGHFNFKSGGVQIHDISFEKKTITRRWPFARVQMSDPRLPDIGVDFLAFAPIAEDNPFDTSLPAVLAECNISNSGDATATVTVTYECRGRACEEMRTRPKDNLWLLTGPALSIATMQTGEFVGEKEGASIRWKLAVAAKSRARLRIAVMRFHENGYTTVRLPRPPQLAQYVLRRWDTLHKSTMKFATDMPRSHNPTLDEALRWYMIPAVLLTKITRDGHALTMGYSELNQRDSYWTSFAHLLYWPVLEKKMIEESAHAQRDDGKIPTTILPTIERNDDVDINCYFVLRVFRWAAFRNDVKLLRRMWPHAKAAIEFVRAMDTDGDGLPEQKSFWADWKDVSGVEGRKYAPHFTLLWLAALKSAAHWAAVLDDPKAVEAYESLYRKGERTVNLPLDRGGLWDGKCYVTVWRDGRPDRHVLEDQVVGVLFGVVDSHRAASVFDALQPNETSWGVRETYPYYPEEKFGLRGGDYHNGAIWPYLNFVDALARLRAGRSPDGVRIMEKVADADLTIHGDFLPHENIDGETGENTHKYLQGWDAVFLAAFYFGIMEPGAAFF